MEFKTGDRVKVTVCCWAGAKLGECGTVIGKDGTIVYQVKFDEYDSRRHSCNSKCDDGYGWNCTVDMLEPATKFKVGDKVRVLNGSVIENYTGGWAVAMYDDIDKIVTIESIEIFPGGRTGYYVKETSKVYDERGLELATDESAKWCDGFRGGKIPSLILPKVEYVFDKKQAQKIHDELISHFNAFPKEDKPMKLTFSTTEGYRINKSNNTKIPTITTKVTCESCGLTYRGSATCDKFTYDERQGVLEALANAILNGNFDREYNRAVKKNKVCEIHDRTCTYCGKVFDTVEERKEHEAWHVERRKARHERYLLRKRAKEIAFEEQAQKMAKEMLEEQK